MQKSEQLYEGKAKKVFKTDDPEVYIVDYKDDATAFDGLKKGTIVGKGVVNNRMSNLLFQMLEKKGIPTHFVKELSERETAVKKVSIVPLEVIVRNIAAGSFSKRFGVEEGTVLKCPTLEFCLKDDDLHDPMINEYHILALDLASKEDLETITDMTFRVNDALKTLSWNSAVLPTVKSSLPMRFRRIPAACGIRRPMKSWIRTGSAGTWAAWRMPTTRLCAASAWRSKQLNKNQRTGNGPLIFRLNLELHGR